MKIARVGTGYIILIWALVVILLGSVIFIGYRRNTKDLGQLMMNEAERLIEVVSVSAQAGIHALDEVEYLTEQRLLENARFIERITRDTVPSHEYLSQIALENDLHMINILDPQGRSIMRVNPSDDPVPAERQHRPEVESVLSGDSDEEVIGFMESSYYSGKRYGVVVRRESGGAVVVNTDSDEMLEFRKTVGLGTLFKEIGSREGITYIVLQDTLGILAASNGVNEMTRIVDDPFLIRTDRGQQGSRIITADTGRLLEVAHPLIVDDVNLGIMRIGLSTAEIDGIRVRAVRQFIFLFVAAMVSGVFVLVYVFLRQNYMILNAEHDRILQDVRRMEEETRRSERLASMGRLAAGVAHEIRNPLNSISIITQRLRAEFAPARDEDEYRGYLSTIGREITRISVIIEQFLKYARPPKLILSPVNATDLVEDVLNVVGEKARTDGITIDTVVDADLKCLCDVDQMKQALMNIVLNALDASSEHGSVLVKAVRKNDEVVISVEDYGGGISDENLGKIFDPYFTTKHGGNGLGLSEVHRIVTVHGGRVTAENARNGGAVFSIYLPGNGEKK